MTNEEFLNETETLVNKCYNTAKDSLRREIVLLELLSDLIRAIRTDDDRAIALLINRAEEIFSHRITS